MNILYLGKYTDRFSPVIELIRKHPPGSRVLELCFGDTFIASFCKREGYPWTGLDINHHFVAEASSLGYNAHQEDIALLPALPEAEICVMTGSLYHFHPHTQIVMTKMLKAAPVLILSEPVRNLSSAKGFLGFLARRSANAGKGNEAFRYNRNTLLSEIRNFCEMSLAEITSIDDFGKDLILKLEKNG